MQRYTVTIVSGGTPGQRPTLVVPFEPSAIVTAFIEELFKRIARQGLALAANTHIATLHLDSETGAIIDCEDVLADVVDPKSEKLFAVFSEKQVASQQAASQAVAPPSTTTQGSISVRVITPALAILGVAKSGTASTIQLPLSTTLRQLHAAVASHLGLPDKPADFDTNECNCTLARKLADGPSPPTQFVVVHGKSVVQRFDLTTASENAVKGSIREHFGQSVESTKKLSLYGAETHAGTPTRYKKTPVASMCSKHRHVPVHARVVDEDANAPKSRVLDLHTSETPILAASMDAKIESAGLPALAIDGVLDIYAVHRLATDGTTSSVTQLQAGKGSIFRARAHWAPSVPQSDRGQAMMLSSLRVFASLVQGISDDERTQDAVLHVFDLLAGTGFPPALRTLRTLFKGRTPTAVDSAALAHILFEILDKFMPTAIIGTTHSRVFEGARLLFGFILEKARTLKLAEGTERLPYISAFQDVDLKDHITTEAVAHAVNTTDGLIERYLYDAFAEGGLLAEGHLQPNLVTTEQNSMVARIALTTLGSASEVMVFNLQGLKSNYQYADAGNVGSALDLTELTELSHLAELSGRNKLAVHRPSQLASAVAPCLTFDRNAHLAVYTGQEGCGEPGRSSLVFRPQHGEAAIDTAVVEQLIVPILQRYEAEGTAVFDALGGATVRRLQTPDEIVVFAIDTSASMRQPTDFAEVNGEDPFLEDEAGAAGLVEAEHYNNASFDDMKEYMSAYESFDDMIAIVADADAWNKRSVASEVLNILRMMLSSAVVEKHTELDDRRNRGLGYYGRRGLTEMETALKKLKDTWAGLQTHEQALLDYFLYRSTTQSTALTQRWTWTLGEQVPASSPPNQLPSLSAAITDVPDDLRCPISHTLMEDAVTAADNCTYSRSAILQWFSIRSSSPLHGLPLSDTSLNANEGRCDAVSAYISGKDLVSDDEPAAKKTCPADSVLSLTFATPVGAFERRMPSSASLEDLYKVAFRGLKARHMVFQLTLGDNNTLYPTRVTLAARGLQSGARIDVRIADESSLSMNVGGSQATMAAADELCLVKVFASADKMMFAYWTKRSTCKTVASVLWKYWRHQMRTGYLVGNMMVSEKTVWSDLAASGDGLYEGCPLKHTKNLSQYLNRAHCSGHLGSEMMYAEEGSDFRSAAADQPLVLKLQVTTACKRKVRDSRLSRLDVLKQQFEALINRQIAYAYNSHVGLVSFNTVPRVAMPISHVIENFRRAVVDLQANGETALWDALALARDQLNEYCTKFPAARKRIIVISDGADTKSTSNTARDLTWNLREDGILVDSISLGDDDNSELRIMSYLLGCYRFQPTSLANALAICEMEPFLSITERPDVTPPTGIPRNRYQFLTYYRTAQFLARPTVVTSDNLPPRKNPPNLLQDDFIELASMAASVRSGNVAATGNGSARSNNMRTSRLMSEMKLLANSSTHSTYDVYVSETDMSFWKVVISGPADTPYEDGTFLMYLHADEGYPTFAPKARFITKIMHPNVNAHGRICTAVFDRDWTSDTSMGMVLDTVYGLLYQPENSDTVNTSASLDYNHDSVEYADQVRDYVERYAPSSREQWRAQILGLEVYDEDDEEEVEEDDESSGERGEDEDEEMS